MSGTVSRTTVCLIWGLATLAAQEGPIRVQTRFVQVPVSVKAKDGRNVEGLAARDFLVLEDGVQREVSADVFDAGAARICLAIAIQSSAVPAPAVATIRRIGVLIQPLVIGRRGEAAVVTFDREVKWLQDFTRDPREIQRAVKNLKTGSPLQAHLLDAIAEVADRMREREGRKVLLVISDSRDRGSETSLDEAVNAVEREGIEVFGAHYSSKDTNAIQELAEATGGRNYPFLKERGIEKAIEDLGVEVHSQYILSFPQRSDIAGMHQITVSIPKRSDLQIHSRQAYWVEGAQP